ncbi:hypothetical protein HYU20_02475 [Candidatus Woesearchaeota archaeon]|nr:hypothetical protein [Candidatus Woesearchaeota archaeon]
MGKGYATVVEGKAVIAVPVAKKLSSDMPVFYNPVMRSNRNITLVLIAAAAKKYGIEKWSVADPMAATGIREIRMLLELGGSKFERVAINDYSSAAAALIRKNLALNGIKSKKVAVTANEANKFLLNNKPFSYIDIDPFGYPGTFLDAAVRRIRHNGILAVTATDTSALSGSATAACQRKYLATPLRNGFMHEIGVRILVRLAQLFGAVHEKALLPVFCYYKEHYMRAFFLCRDGAGRVDELLMQHKEFLYCLNCCGRRIKGDYDDYRCSNCKGKMAAAGPLWSGRLFDNDLAAKMASAALKNKFIDEKTKQFLALIAEEAKAEANPNRDTPDWALSPKSDEGTGVGFYAIEDVCEKHRIGQQPKTAEVIKRLHRIGYNASPTHCTTTGVKTNAPLRAVVAACQQKDL